MPDAPKRMSPERLERYGVQFPSKHFPSLPTHAPMADGYWTPYHTAAAALDALRADLARVTAERDAEILRLRTAENAAGVAIDRLRVAFTDCPPGTHPSEIVARIENADTMERDMTSECRAGLAEAGHDGPYALDNIVALVAERDSAIADCKALAAECRCSRQYDNLLHTCDRDPTRPCQACEAAQALEAARAATNASGALARHGGGA